MKIWNYASIAISDQFSCHLRMLVKLKYDFTKVKVDKDLPVVYVC